MEYTRCNWTNNYYISAALINMVGSGGGDIYDILQFNYIVSYFYGVLWVVGGTGGRDI